MIGEVNEVFQQVGGIGQLPRSNLERFVKRLGVDDCLLIDDRPFIVEYDETLHFSPYRKISLASPIYNDLHVGFDRAAYVEVCGSFRLATGSGRAHNTSAHASFRCPVSPGECRHRQRAFYDFLKDVILGTGLPGFPGLIRISDRTDFLDGKPPGEVVEHGAAEDRQALCTLLRQRAGGTK